MVKIKQKVKTIHNQYIAETINFGEVKSSDDFVLKLQELQAELEKAIDARALSEGKSLDAEYQVKKAIAQAKSPTPDKTSLIEHLKTAKELVTGVDGLVAACAGAITRIGSFF